MRAWHLELGVACAAVALGIVGACSFPTVETADPSGSGGNPGTTTTTLAGQATTLAGPTTTTDAGPTSSSSTTTDVGGSSSVSSSSDGGGGGSSTSTAEGGGGDGGNSASTSTLTGVGGGVVDVACDNGCVPFPEEGGGGSGGSPPTDDDCDDDGDPNIEDCQPCDPLVFHEQTNFFDDPFTPFEEGADPSFDYDCSGGAQLEYVFESNGCTAFDGASCPDEPIFTTPAVCGQAATTQGCTVTGLLGANCTSSGPSSQVDVRCR